jgi:hypothetical protein
MIPIEVDYLSFVPELSDSVSESSSSSDVSVSVGVELDV